MWEFLLFKLPKEMKDAKRNISVHFKTSLAIVRLDLISYWNMDGRHKTTNTIKKRPLEPPKYAQPLSVSNIFSSEVSICSIIQVFPVCKPSHITPTKQCWDGSTNWSYILTVKLEKRGFLRLLCQQFWKIIFRLKVIKAEFQKPNVFNLKLTSLWKLDLNLSKHFNILCS